jgi:glycosyltransferase involved in cell wall biosynthesis
MTRRCILHISANRYPELAVEHHTKDIWRALAVGFDEYHVLARNEGKGFSKSKDGNIYLHLLPAMGKKGWTFFITSWVLFFYVIRVRPTYIISQCPVIGGIAAVFYGKLFNIPVLVEVHGAQYFHATTNSVKSKMKHFFFRAISTVGFRFATKIRSLSEDMTDNLKKVYGPEIARKAVVIPTRVDMDVFNVPKSSYETKCELALVTIGSLISIKNHLSLIQDLAHSDISWRLTIVGEGPLEEKCKKMALQLGVGSRVVMAGRLGRSELAKTLIENDVYIHYSKTEALSRAILEAMAVGLPVIATNVGFIKGVLIHHSNAIVLQQPWRDSLLSALLELQQSQAKRERYGANARKTVMESFDAKLVFSLYRKTIGGIQ